MLDEKHILRRLPALAATLLVGCAPAYHSYSGCQVNCTYCPPSPLPYAYYSECVCHSHAAQPYLNFTASAPESISAPPDRTPVIEGQERYRQ